MRQQDLRQVISSKRDQYTINIRKKAKQQNIEFKRERNIKLLQEMSNNSGRGGQYYDMAIRIQNNQNKESVMGMLINNLDKLKNDLMNCELGSYRCFAVIFQQMFDQEKQMHSKYLTSCFQILIEKGREFLNSCKDQYVLLIRILLGLIIYGIQYFLSYMNQATVNSIKFILFEFFNHYSNQWQSQQLLESGLTVLNRILSINEQLKQICEVTEASVVLKRRKFTFIKYIFYNQKIFIDTILDILQNVSYSYPNDSIRITVLKILVRLTYWANNPTFIQPLVDANIYESCISFMDKQNSLEMNSLLMKLLQNLISSDYEISKRAFEDGIISKLLGDIFSHQKNIDLNSHVRCLCTCIKELDLNQFDVRDQIDFKHNPILILQYLGIDFTSQLSLLEAILLMVQEYKLILGTQNIQILQRVAESNRINQIDSLVSQIVQLSDSQSELQGR